MFCLCAATLQRDLVLVAHPESYPFCFQNSGHVIIAITIGDSTLSIVEVNLCMTGKTKQDLLFSNSIYFTLTVGKAGAVGKLDYLPLHRMLLAVAAASELASNKSVVICCSARTRAFVVEHCATQEICWPGDEVAAKRRSAIAAFEKVAVASDSNGEDSMSTEMFSPKLPSMLAELAPGVGDGLPGLKVPYRPEVAEDGDSNATSN
ncbi:hypothetical protein BJ742DRAFT_745766 [Cladochytrium replicatum]|nr:hypothetical protein BJ742DRAFT_745766 [Cladochytrium replicatum]